MRWKKTVPSENWRKNNQSCWQTGINLWINSRRQKYQTNIRQSENKCKRASSWILDPSQMINFVSKLKNFSTSFAYVWCLHFSLIRDIFPHYFKHRSTLWRVNLWCADIDMESNEELKGNGEKTSGRGISSRRHTSVRDGETTGVKWSERNEDSLWSRHSKYI